jgi:hypothetical protein
MQLIPITKAYRKGYEGIKWDVDDWGVVKAVGKPIQQEWEKYGSGYVYQFPRADKESVLPRLDKIPGMPAARYWGC